MINFIDKRDDKIVKLSYSKVAQEFLVSPANVEESGFIVSMITFLDYMEGKQGLKFVKLNSVDWEELWQATIRIKLGLDRELVA